MKAWSSATIGKVAWLPGVANLFLGAWVLFMGACSPRSEPSAAPPQAQQDRVTQPTAAQDFRQRQIAFLNRIRDADPQQRVIDRAMLNERNELGLILDRTVEMNRIPELMRTFLTQMAREFPGQDLTVIAYAPSQPPQKMGTAYLDAQSKQMKYVPEY